MWVAFLGLYFGQAPGENKGAWAEFSLGALPKTFFPQRPCQRTPWNWFSFGEIQYRCAGFIITSATSPVTWNRLKIIKMHIDKDKFKHRWFWPILLFRFVFRWFRPPSFTRHPPVRPPAARRPPGPHGPCMGPWVSIEQLYGPPQAHATINWVPFSHGPN